MYKIIDDKNCFKITIKNNSTQIAYTPSYKGKRIKIIQSVVVFNVNSLGNNKNFDVYINNQIIDKINISSSDNAEKVCINITDEVNDFLFGTGASITIELRNVALTSTSQLLSSIECMNEYIMSNQWLSNNAYQEVSVRKAGNLKINLATRDLNLTHEDVTSKSKILPVKITHIFNSFNIESDIDKVKVKDGYVKLPKTKCGNGWKLNCQQYLVKERPNTSIIDNDVAGNYTYIKDDGSHILFQEKFYYLDDNNKKNYLYPSQISINLDKTLFTTVNSKKYEVKTEIITDSDYNLISKLEGFKGLEYVDIDVDEVKTLKNQAKELKDALTSGKLSDDEKTEYQALLTKRIFEINEYEKQVPDIFIENKDGSMFMGFAKFKKESLYSEKDIPSKTSTTQASIQSTADDLLEEKIDKYTDIYRLVVIGDKYDNVIYVKYEDAGINDTKKSHLDYKVKSVVDSDNNTITFNYDDNDMLKEVIDDKGNILKYNYSNTNENYYLTSIVYSDNMESKYEYDSKNRLSKICDYSGYSVGLTYYTSSITLSEFCKYKGFKFNEQPELNKNSSGVAKESSRNMVSLYFYDYKSTTVIDRFGGGLNRPHNYKTYIFDIYGKPVTIYNGYFKEKVPDQKKLNSLSYTYSDNKISKTIKKFNNAKNLLNVATESYVGDDSYMGDDIYTSLVETEDSTIYNMTGENKIYSREIDGSTIQLMSERSGSFVFSAWAKADSAYINKYENLDSYDEIENVILSNLDSSKKSRKFELRADIKYSGEDKIYSSSSSFDWMQTEWQYLELPITIDKTKKIEKIQLYVDYSENTGDISYFELSLKECFIETNIYDSDKLLVESHNSYFDTKTTYEYRDKKLVKTTLSYNGKDYISENKYNSQGSLVKSIDYNGMVKEYLYNDKGIIVKTSSYNLSDPTSKFVTASDYNDKGVEVGTIDEFGEKSETYQYSDDGNAITGITDKNGNKTVYGYNPQTNKLMSISTIVDGEENKNSYGYTLGLLTRVSHNDINIDYELDGYGDFVNAYIDGKKVFNYFDNDISSNPYHCYTYDYSSIYEYYDDQRRTTRVSYGSKDLIENSYDENNNLVTQVETVYDENNLYKYAYDDMGNKNYESKTATGTENKKEIEISTKYNKFNNVTQETIAIEDDGVLNYNYQYDDTLNNELQSIELPNNLSQNIEYDCLNRLSFINYGNKFSKQISYLKKGEYCSNLVSSVRYGKNSKSDSYLKYVYDNMGNIVKVLEDGSEIARYSYDSLSRLVREDNKQFGKSYFIEYDKGGNILRKRFCSYTLKPFEEIEESSFSENLYVYPDKGWKDQLKSFNGATISYNGIGNPIWYRGKSFTWGNVRNLEKIGSTIIYKYNANGIRTSKKVNNVTTKFYLKDNKIVAQDNGNKLYFHYGVDGLVGFTYKVSDTEIKEYYYKTNTLGDIIGIYDSNLNLIVKYVYDAWGNQKAYVLCNKKYLETTVSNSTTEFSNNKTIATLNPFRYRGYYYDEESKLYYLNSRYYDPEVGRFINSDDMSILMEAQNIINGLNLYAYCDNNPIMNIDLCGHAWWHWVLGGVIIVASAVVTIATGGAAAGSMAAAVHALASSTLSSAIISSSIGVLSNGVTISPHGKISFDVDKASEGFLMGAATGTISGMLGATLSEVGFSENPIGSNYIKTQMLISSLIGGGVYLWQSLVTSSNINTKELMISMTSAVVSREYAIINDDSTLIKSIIMDGTFQLSEEIIKKILKILKIIK